MNRKIVQKVIQVFLCLFLFVGGFPGSGISQEASGDMIIFPVEDTYVEISKTTSQGNVTGLKVKKADSEYRNAYFQFDMGSVDVAGIDQAEFKVYVNNIDSNTIDQGYVIELQAIDDHAWSEHEVLYTNQPGVQPNETGQRIYSATDRGMVLGTASVTQKEVYISFDVTDYLKAHGVATVSFRLVGVTNNRGATYASKEAAWEKRPMLVIQSQTNGNPIPPDGDGDEPAKVTSISISGLTPMRVGDTSQAVIQAVYSDGSEAVIDSGVIFSSSNPEVASISPSGWVNATGSGTTVIQAAYGELNPATYVLTVEDREEIPEPEPEQSMLSVRVSNDTYVESGKGPLGTEKSMKVKRTSTEFRNAYLGFELPQLVEDRIIESASLRVFVKKLDSNTVDTGYEIEFQGMLDDDWNESSVAYSHQPGTWDGTYKESDQGFFLDQQMVTQSSVGRYLEIDVSEFIQRQTNGKASFRIVGVTSGKGADYATKEDTSLNSPPILEIRTKADEGEPGIPASLAIEHANGQNLLTWSPARHAAGYKVKRSTVSGGPYEVIGETEIPAFIDESFQNGKTYYYTVSSMNDMGESPNSFEASVRTTPTQPKQVTAIGEDRGVRLTWSESAGAEEYKVIRSEEENGSYLEVGGLTSATYLDTGLINGKTYYYKVVAINENGESMPSATVFAAPVAPIVMGTLELSDIFGNPMTDPVPGQLVKVSVPFVNQAPSSISGTLVVGLYHADQSVEVLAYLEANVAPGEEKMEAGFELAAKVEGMTVKAWMVDTLNGINPLSNVSQIPSQQK
ncbi:DNRLRE domain-containing protein [Ammoniphilus sp. YIM 78166]|uniref:CBM96 family carbohydrate-binding protein n=1 Tax=Ammoniphilus sp. YIM 78166 TaxID=1644106 RepID=UPI001070232C|nr:DNRLRE domain-containing protein [Ammoniphilus sp. YIM 78166]